MNATQDNQAPNGGTSTRSLAGGLLMAFGALIATLSGLCTGGAAAIFLPESAEGIGGSSMIPLMIIFGGLPFLVGILLFAWGRGMRRPAGNAVSEPPRG